MKIGIQPTPIGFTNSWVQYCEKNGIDYKLVDCYRNDVVLQLSDCDAFMWNHDLLKIKDNLIAKRLLFALEHSGKIVFPKFEEGWHYDDKIAQKFLLEAIGAPFIPTYIFFDKKTAIQWIQQTSFPKVFKLKGGAGSSNVSLVTSKKQAIHHANKAFSSGFKTVKKDYFLKETLRNYRSGKISFMAMLKGGFRYFLPIDKSLLQHREKNYIYFQDFLPDNDSDLRIVVIDQNKAFGIRRFNRENDFRASGSGNIEYLDESNMPEECIKIAFDTAKKLNMNSIAYDFVYGKNGKPMIIEITYAFGSKASKANGYWDDALIWHKAPIRMQEWMIENLITEIRKKKMYEN